MDTPLDFAREKAIMEKEEMHFAKMDCCEKCLLHGEGCPYYDAEEESWDFEKCYEDGWD